MEICGIGSVLKRERGGGKSEKFEESACVVLCGLRGKQGLFLGRGGIE